MDLTTMLYAVEPPIATITLNRPQVLNAINTALERELREVLEAAEADDDVRVILLKGNGRAFSAGYDLKETVDKPVEGVVAWRRRLMAHLKTMMAVWDVEKPVIAAVHGYALGGGCDLAMICDLTIATESAYFGEPEIRFGSGTVNLIMPWTLGIKKTKELLYTGHDRLTAREAEAIGLINRVVPDADLDRAARAMAMEVAKQDLEALRLTKVAINRTYEIMGLKAAMQYNIEVDTQMEAAETPERREFNRIRGERGLKAALDWRDARFR